MSHFAKVENGIVTQVIVAEQDVIDSGLFGTGWVQTSYNTHAGQHPEGRPMRKNYAGIGYTYDAQRDAFMPPQPYPSWLLNEDTCLWSAPTPYPTDGERYVWDEPTASWVVPAPQEQSEDQNIVLTESVEMVSATSSNTADAVIVMTSADSV